MAPFTSRKVGPEWFTRPYPSEEDDVVDEFVSMWEAFLRPRIMPLRFKSSKNQLSLIAYQPNLVSRQFGIAQSLPSPIYPREKLLLFYNADYSEDAATKHIGRYSGRTTLTLFDFNLHFLNSTTSETWWRHYYEEEFFDEKDFAHHLCEAFKLVLDRVKKGIPFSIPLFYQLLTNHSCFAFRLAVKRVASKKTAESTKGGDSAINPSPKVLTFPFLPLVLSDVVIDLLDLVFYMLRNQPPKSGRFKRSKSLAMRKRSLHLFLCRDED